MHRKQTLYTQCSYTGPAWGLENGDFTHVCHPLVTVERRAGALKPSSTAPFPGKEPGLLGMEVQDRGKD